MDELKYIIFAIAIIICKIIDVIGKYRRIIKLEKLDNSKIESIGKYEGKLKSNFSILTLGKNKVNET